MGEGRGRAPAERDADAETARGPGPQEQGRWVVVALTNGHEDVGGIPGRSICLAEIPNGEIQRNGIF